MPYTKIEDYRNGLIFGIVFGILAAYAIMNIAQLSFVSGWLTGGAGWFTSQTWRPSFMSSVVFTEYLILAIIGGFIGIYVDLK